MTNRPLSRCQRRHAHQRARKRHGRTTAIGALFWLPEHGSRLAFRSPGPGSPCVVFQACPDRGRGRQSPPTRYLLVHDVADIRRLHALAGSAPCRLFFVQDRISWCCCFKGIPNPMAKSRARR